jgi:glutathione S-transferase
MTLIEPEAIVKPLVLRTTLTSPYGRKVRMAAYVLGLADLLRPEPADTRDYSDTLMQQNPLGKMPCLILADGAALHGSDVIIDYLAYRCGDTSLTPWQGEALFRALTRRDTCNGIADAALLMIYEKRFRDPALASPIWLDHCEGKIRRGLGAIEAALPDPQHTDVVGIALASALGYLDWRKPLEWRASHPDLVQWLEAFREAEPAFDATAA